MSWEVEYINELRKEGLLDGKKFSELRSAMAAEAQARSEQLTNEMPLHELRQARGLSQQVLARLLKVQQPADCQAGATNGYVHFHVAQSYRGDWRGVGYRSAFSGRDCQDNEFLSLGC